MNLSNTIRQSSLALLAGSVALLAACSSSDSSTDPEMVNPPPTTESMEGDEQVSMPSPTIDQVPQVRVIPGIGSVYTSDDGLTLYTRYTDEAGEITCGDSCETTWPPLLTDVDTPGISGQFDVIERADGSYQWTLDNYPLYLYVGDAAPDEANGDGVNDQWAVARPLPVTSADVLGDEGLVSSTTTLADGVAETRSDLVGHTLYFFTQDSAGVSTCNNGCAANWPPLYADKGAVDRDRYSIITRDDDTRQWAYDEQALYYYLGDTAPSQALGDGIGGIWNVARP